MGRARDAYDVCDGTYPLEGEADASEAETDGCETDDGGDCICSADWSMLSRSAFRAA